MGQVPENMSLLYNIICICAMIISMPEQLIETSMTE